MELGEISIWVGVVSGVAALIMQFRSLILEREILKISAYTGYSDGSGKQSQSSVSVVLLNKGKSKVYIHKFGIREPKRTETTNGIKLTVKGGVYHTIFNDMSTLCIEPNEKKVFHFDGYSEAGIKKVLELKRVRAYVVDSNGKTHSAIIKAYGI
ncbi:hypothetical protein ACFPTX_13695 [Pseudomonas sp. GCM10022188]|uniref:hypothetical protein n=1 Tax=Pseudomonas TaxID=286 RepID=UPI001E4F0740|nr:hypothetical protein [Pseudomonas oryzagri]MCC6074341.1 hypothetical protein [Pseudomonas oryzagri]